MHARLTLGAAATLALVLLLLPAGARADCGPGPIVFKQSKGIIQQMLALTTNVTLLPTWAVGVTIGTSGCSNSGVVRADMVAELFVAWNADAVGQEAAQGRGEHLTALAGLLGCPLEARAIFARLAQARYADLPADAQAAPGQWVAQLRAGLSADPTLAGRCTDAG